MVTTRRRDRPSVREVRLMESEGEREEKRSKGKQENGLEREALLDRKGKSPKSEARSQHPTCKESNDAAREP